MSYNICIAGGGNGAHVTAGYLASKGYTINVLTRRPNLWKDTIEIHPATDEPFFKNKGVLYGHLNRVSDQPQDVINRDTKIVLVCVPAHVHSDILVKIAPYCPKDIYIGTIFAQGMFDLNVKSSFGDYFDNVKCIFGLQNIPWICKINKYGESARIIGPKKTLYCASYPVSMCDEICTLLNELYDIPASPLANFLCLTLTPSNQIIHPARYSSIFYDYDGIKTYTKQELADRKGLFLYDNFDELSAETLSRLDNELQQIKYAIMDRYPQCDLTQVLPIQDRIILHYGDQVSDTSSLKQTFCSNIGYRGCGTPLVEVSKGRFQPATGSRVFWEDIPYGLCILKSLAELCGRFPTPAIDNMIRWHQQYMGKEFLLPDNTLNPLLLMETGSPFRYGVSTLEEVVETSIPNELKKYHHPRSML